MSTLYVVESGAHVHKSAERLVVEKEGRPLASVRMNDLELLCVSTSVQLSTQAIAACITRGVRVCLLGGARVVASIEPDVPSNVLTRIAQVDRLRDAAYRERFARSVVGEKLTSCLAVLRLWRESARASGATDVRRDLDGLIARFEAEHLPRASASAPPDVDPIDHLRGVEGAAAVGFFDGLRRVLPSEAGFHARRMHPAPDPVNAALSFAFALLGTQTGGPLAAAGLDLGIGLLHGLRSGRDSLVFDVLEPYRAPVAVVFVARLFGRRELDADDFEAGPESGVLLTDEARRRFLQRWEAWISAPSRGAAAFGLQAGASAPSDSWRMALRAQGRAIRTAIIRGADPEWYWNRTATREDVIEVAIHDVQRDGPLATPRPRRTAPKSGSTSPRPPR